MYSLRRYSFRATQTIQEYIDSEQKKDRKKKSSEILRELCQKGLSHSGPQEQERPPQTIVLVDLEDKTEKAIGKQTEEMIQKYWGMPQNLKGVRTVYDDYRTQAP